MFRPLGPCAPPLSVAKGEATSETKVSEEERCFLAPAGEAASSFPQPRGSLGLAPGTWATARLTASPGSEAQHAPANPTTTLTPAPTPPPTSSTPRAAAERQPRLRAARLRPLCRRLAARAGILAATSHLLRSPVSQAPGFFGRRALRPFQLLSAEMPAGMRVGGARRLPASSVCAFKTFPRAICPVL